MAITNDEISTGAHPDSHQESNTTKMPPVTRFVT